MPAWPVHAGAAGCGGGAMASQLVRVVAMPREGGRSISASFLCFVCGETIRGGLQWPVCWCILRDATNHTRRAGGVISAGLRMRARPWQSCLLLLVLWLTLDVEVAVAKKKVRSAPAWLPLLQLRRRP